MYTITYLDSLDWNDVTLSVRYDCKEMYQLLNYGIGFRSVLFSSFCLSYSLQFFIFFAIRIIFRIFTIRQFPTQEFLCAYPPLFGPCNIFLVICVGLCVRLLIGPPHASLPFVPPASRGFVGLLYGADLCLRLINPQPDSFRPGGRSHIDVRLLPESELRCLLQPCSSC